MVKGQPFHTQLSPVACKTPGAYAHACIILRSPLAYLNKHVMSIKLVPGQATNPLGGGGGIQICTRKKHLGVCE